MRRDFTLMTRHGFIYIFRTCQVRQMPLQLSCLPDFLTTDGHVRNRQRAAMQLQTAPIPFDSGKYPCARIPFIP